MIRAWQTTAFLIGLAASVVTLVWTWRLIAAEAAPDTKFVILLLALFAGGLLLFLVAQEYRYARKARYAESLAYLNRIAAEIQNLAINRDATANEIKEGCENIVNALATAFSLITSTRCSVCIKLIEIDARIQTGTPIRPKVITLSRDILSEARERGSRRLDHWIDQNTDFEELHKRAGTPSDYFFSNYLPGLRAYKNTSFEIYGHPWNSSIPILSDFLRRITWRLPYKSTIVYPIAPKPLEYKSNEYSLAGYLCVDSRSQFAFTRRYDLDLISGVADCLFESVTRYCEQVWHEAKEEEKR